VFSILLFPGGVLLFSEGFLMSETTFVLFNITSGLSDFFLSFSKSDGGIISQLGKSNDLGLVISNFTLHIVGEFFTCCFIILMNSLLILLLLVEG
jgi:hypothetical protein